MAEEQRSSLAEEREFVKRFGPSAVIDAINGRGGYPVRICRVAVVSFDVVTGLATVQELGDSAIKEDVPWLLTYPPTINEVVWYLKFGADGFLFGPTVRDMIESTVPQRLLYGTAGIQAVNATAGQASGSAAVTFPFSFVAVPSITCTLRSSGTKGIIVEARNPTVSGFDAYWRTADGTTISANVTYSINWHAFEIP